jgi:alpha-tubulin suppressor-like RCC1 family protein
MKTSVSLFVRVLALLMLPAIAGAQTVAGGAQHTVVATPGGTVWTWGNNTNGQLGDGTTTAHKTPDAVSTISGVTAVAAGQAHTLALKSDGTVWAWGANSYGQLGDQTTTQRTSPVQVYGLSTIIAIAAGENHSVALTSGGSVWVWGRNANGQIGDGTTTQSTQPVLMTTLSSLTAIGAGYNHTLAVKSDGTAWAWGLNANGQLGDASTTQRTSPVQMSGITSASMVTGGNIHSLILKSDGTLRAVGNNFYGQIGDGSTTQRTSSVSTGLTSVTAIAAGQHGSYALRSDGTVWAWGTNTAGQVGDGTTTQRTSPTQASGLAGIALLGAGLSHAISVTSTGIVSTWGDNLYGQLGDGTTVARSTASAISGTSYTWKVGTPVFSIAAGTYSVEKTVVVTEATAGAAIHYTLDGVTPTESDTVITSGSSVTIDETRTLKARAFKSGMPASDVALASYVLAVASVTLSPAAGTYTSAQTVSMTTTSSGVTIRYTLDGTTPTTSSTAYTSAISVGTSTTVKAVGFRYNWSSSAVASAAYTMNFGTLAAPSLSPGTSTSTSEAVVTMGSIAGATVRYTTNGQTPTTSSTAYSGPVSITATTTVIAKAFHPDYTAGPTTTATYTIVVATPVFSPTAGTYTAGQIVAASSATSGATLNYTLNGATPTSTDPVFPAGGLVAGNFTVKVIGVKTGATTSGVASASYQITGTLASARVIGGDTHSLAIRPDAVAFGWGANSSGQLGDGTTTARNLPVIVNGLTGIVGMAAGDSHSLAVTSAGAAYAWGNNTNGRLGDGTTTQRNLPTAVQSLSSVAGVAAGGSHSLAVKTDGTVWAWGNNTSGQLGNGNTTQQLTAVQTSTLTNVTAIVARATSSYALRSDGGVWSWGGNGNGQLGSGNTTARSTPGQIAGLTATALGGGGTHVLALLGDGTLKAWGYNLYGQLGDGTTTQRTSPVSVSSLSSVAAIAAGSLHSLALLSDGTVWAWGSNANGQLGDGTTTNRSTAVAVTGLPAIASISAGTLHSLAIGTDGSVWVWGRNTERQLGDGTTTTRTSPVQIAGAGMAWKIAPPVLSLASGLFYASQTVTVTCTDVDAVLHYTTDGTEPTESATIITSGGTVAVNESLTIKVRGWKPGAVSSELASGVYELKAVTPVLSPASGAYASSQTVTMTTTTPSATLTYTTDGSEPGLSSTSYSGSVTVSDTRSVKARAYRTGWTASDSATASYWISAGTVVTPSITPAGGTLAAPPLVAMACTTSGATVRFTLDGSDPTEVSPRFVYPILVTLSGTVKAKAFKPGFAPSAVASVTYALDPAGQTGMASIVPGGGRFATQQTVTISGPSGAVLRYTTTGTDPTDTDTSVPTNGQLVIGSAQILKVRAWLSGATPSAVRRADFVITGMVAAGHQHSLALKANGDVLAWGRGSEGQLGDGTGLNRDNPVSVLTGVASVSGGQWHSLTVMADGTVRGWGTNGGRLGDGTTTSRQSPVQSSGLTNVIAVAAGFDHSLALKSDGTLWAFGTNTYGQLGDGTTTTRTSAVQVVGLSGVTAIAAGDGFSVAVQGDGAGVGLVWAWGKNTSGQLGDGSILQRTIPVRVIGLSDTVQVAASQDFAVARLFDGTVKAWGSNAYAQLGDFSGGFSPIPVPIPALSGVTFITAGLRHALAIDGDSRTWGWGSNANSQLGTQNYAGAVGVGAPQLVPDATAAMGAAGGWQHTIVLRADGTVWATGGLNATGLGWTQVNELTVIPNVSLVSNASLFDDVDQDGLATWEEYAAGTDPLVADSNGNGLSDLVDVRRRSQSANPDDDADGVPNVVELAQGTDPFLSDTDADGVSDLLDAFPLDPTRWLTPVSDPNDHTPPVITLTRPAGARPIGGGE